jgi:L-ascorbate metabolism protein UlaG (beta-lactamase superfamily)
MARPSDACREGSPHLAWRLLPAVLVAGIAPALLAQEPPLKPTRRIRDEVRAHREGVAVWWVGNAGWLIKSGDVLVGTDLDLTRHEKIHEPPISAEDLAPLIDVVFVTHHHGDHCNGPTLRALADRSNATFVLPKTCADAQPDLRIASDRLVVPTPLEPFDVRRVRVEPIHAVHGNQDFTVLTREPAFVDGIRYNCGYVLTIGGKRFLQPGDSVLTEEHLALRDIDVLFVSPTVHNMHLDRSAILVNQLEPAYVIPQHFDTYREAADNLFWTRGYPDELRLRLSRTLQARYHKLAQGEKLEIR